MCRLGSSKTLIYSWNHCPNLTKSKIIFLQVSLKEREVEIRNVELTALSKAKFYQIDRLKKKLSDAEESLVSLCFEKSLL